MPMNTDSLFLLLNADLISNVAILLPHTDTHRSEFTHKCTFSRGSCCFCYSNCYKKSTRNFEITYCFSITASNFYPDAWFSSAL